MLTIKKEITVKQIKYFGLITKGQAIMLLAGAVIGLGLYNYGDIIAWAVQRDSLMRSIMIETKAAEESVIKTN